MWITRFDLGYLHAINHSSAASHRSIARTLQNCSHLCQGVCYRLVWQVAQVWAPPAQAQERRAPTIGEALLPTGSGPASTCLLSYDTAVMVGRAQTRPCRGAATEGGKKTNVSGVPARVPKSVFPQHRTREWGHWCPSEHSLMNTRGRPSSIL